MKAHSLLVAAVLPLVLAGAGASSHDLPEAPLALETASDGHGSTIVMLGGGTGGAAAFAPHARKLAKEYRVLRPESLRLERNRRNQPLPRGYSIKMESAALERTLDQLGLHEPVALVGHSFGALVALDFALDRPGRVRALVLAEPPAFWIVPPDILRADQEMQSMIELTRNLGPSTEPTDEQLIRFQLLLGRAGTTPPASDQPAWQEWTFRRSALRGLSAVPGHQDDPIRLNSLRTPVLIVTGRDTVGFHRRINDRLAARIPQAERAELPGAHGAPGTAPDEFVATVRDFLDRHR
jgi:lipase